MIAVLTIAGLIIIVIVAVLRWQKPAYRFMPFLYATITSLIFFRGQNKSILDLIIAILAMNGIAGLLMFVIWLEGIRRKRKNEQGADRNIQQGGK